MNVKRFFSKSVSMLALATAGLVFVTGCSNDDDDGTTPSPSSNPTITTTSSTTVSVEPGETFTISWDARKNPNGKDLDVFTITENNVDQTGLTTAAGNGIPYNITNANDEQYVDSVTITANSNEGTYVYLFKVTDKDALSASFTVNVTVAPATTPLSTEETGAFYHLAGLEKGAYDLDSNMERSSSESEALKDMINTDAASETFTGSWMAGNTTMFVKDNSFDYTNATVESATAAYTAGTAASSVTNPAVDDIYVAYVRGSYYAVVKITAIDPSEGTGSNTGKITFTYKK